MNKKTALLKNLLPISAARFVFLLLLAAAFSMAPLSCRAATPQTTTAPTVTGEKLQAFVKQFKYDPAMPLNAEEKLVQKSGGSTQYHVTFDSINKERVPAFLYLPTKKEKAYPCIIVQHGYGGDKSMGGAFASMLRGYAVISIDIQYHGERKQEGKDVLSTDVESNARALFQTVVDLERTVDYLKSRGDIDMSKIGYIGVSLGSFLGAIFTGVDDRVKATVLIVGGGGWDTMLGSSKVGPFDALRDMYKNIPYSDYENKMTIVEPLNYIGLISPRPLLMINCTDDTLVPKPTADALYAAAHDPKESKWYTCGGGTGHIPPLDKALGISKNWFKKSLGQ